MKFEIYKILSNFNDFNSHLILNSVNFSQFARHRIDAKIPVMKDKVKNFAAYPMGMEVGGGIGGNRQDVTIRISLKDG